MKKLFAGLLLAVVPALLTAAPAPFVKEKKPAFTVAGSWSMQWGDRVNYALTLDKDGSYHARNSGEDWRGSWTYDDKLRLLTVSETPDGGQTWLYWSVRLDADLKGNAALNDGKAVKFKLHAANVPIEADEDD